MKRFFALLLTIVCFSPMLQAQWDNGLGHFTEEEIRERDAINQEIIEKRRWQNDYYYNYLRSNQYNSQLYQTVSNAVSNAQSGVRIESSSYSLTPSPSNHVTHQQTQQMKKAQYEANHRAWLEQRRAQQAHAAEQARIMKEREEQRKKEEQERKYNQVLANQYQFNETRYNQLHSNVDYKATEGFERMMYHQPSGTEKIRSQFIPTTSTYDIASIVSKSGNNPIPLSLTGNETIKYTNYEEEWLKCMKRIELPRKREYPSKDGKIWDKMRNTLDETQIQGIAYAMKSTNVRSVETIDSLGNITTVKEGVLPTAMGINNKGNYVFESVSYSNFEEKKHFDRIYEVTPNGTLTYITLDEHFFDDENIIMMVREGRFTNELKHAIDVKFVGGSISLKDLKDASPEKLRNLLPEIKAEFKMNLFDNSSTVKGKVVYFAPESNIVNTVIQMKDPSHSSFSVGVGGEFSGGEKGEIRIRYGTNKWFTKPNKESNDEDEEKHWLPEMKAGVTTAEAKAYVEAGSIKKVGKQFIQCNGMVHAKGSLELDYITAVTRNPLRRNAAVGWSCKIITTPEDQIPTERK